MRARALIVALVGAAAGAGVLWLGITTSMRPNEGTAQGPYDLVITGLAVWALTGIVVPILRVGVPRPWAAAAAVAIVGVALAAAVLLLAVHVAEQPAPGRGTDDRAFLLVGLAPFVALAAGFVSAWILTRPPPA